MKKFFIILITVFAMFIPITMATMANDQEEALYTKDEMKEIIYIGDQKYKIVYEPTKEAQEIIDKFTLGATKEDIINLFGNNYNEVTSLMDDNLIWRYDINKKEGYKVPKCDIGAEIAQVDLIGINQNNVQMQLFIKWSGDNKAKTYSLHYKDKKGNIYSYKLATYDGEPCEHIKRYSNDRLKTP